MKAFFRGPAALVLGTGLAVTLILPDQAHAAAPTGGQQVTPQSGSPAVAAMLHRFGHVTRLFQTQARSSTVSSAGALQIPWSTFPSTASKEESNTLKGGGADDPNKNPFADPTLFHRQAYSTHGLVAGFEQDAQISFGQTQAFALIGWFGSYYASVQDAQGRVDDAVNTLGYSHIQSQPCYLDDQPNCRLFIEPYGSQAVVIYAIWSSDNAVGELTVLGSTSTLGPNKDTLGPLFLALERAGDRVIVAAGGSSQPGTLSVVPPAQPTITIDQNQLLRNVKGKLKPSSKLHMQETGLFFCFFHVSSAGTLAADGKLSLLRPKAKFTVTQNGQEVYSGNAQIESTPDLSKLFFDVEGNFDDDSTLGKMQATYTLSLGSATTSGTVTFTVVGALPTTAR